MHSDRDLVRTLSWSQYGMGWRVSAMESTRGA